MFGSKQASRPVAMTLGLGLAGLFLCVIPAWGETYSAAVITNPTANSTFASSDVTFRWTDTGSPTHYLYCGSTASGNDYYSANEGASHESTVTGLPTNSIVYVRLWTKVDDVSTNNMYWYKDYVFNVDADNDGIRDVIDPDPSNYNERVTLTGTNFVLSLLGSGRVANLQVSQSLYDDMAVGNANAHMTTLSRMVLAYFDDVFDCIFFTSDQDTAPGASYAGKHYGVQNDTAGLGKSLYDNTASYGSDGRLYSVIHFPKKGAVASGPSLHEMLHRWANSLSSVPSAVSGHWGFNGIPGQLGGWDPATLTDLGGGNYQANNGRTGSTSFGTVANGGNGLGYADFELYLMGMIPTNGLGDILIPQSPAWVDPGNGVFSASSMSTVSIAQVVAGDGVRVPDHTTAQKAFRLVHVVLSVEPLSNARWLEYDEEVYNFDLDGSDGQSVYNFWEATGGRGTVKMDELFAALRRPEVLALADSNGIAQVEFRPRGMVYYALERSTNLVDWVEVQGALNGTGSVLTVTDPSATNYDRAYDRLRLE